MPNIHETILGKLMARLDLAIKTSESEIEKRPPHRRKVLIGKKAAYKDVKSWYNELVTGTPDPDKTTIHSK